MPLHDALSITEVTSYFIFIDGIAQCWQFISVLSVYVKEHNKCVMFYSMLC